jgi:thiol-disulfide isomerase/thioredoxin
VSRLGRYGAILIGPRAAAARLGPDAGQKDGLLLGAAFVLTSQLPGLAEALASMLALLNVSGLVALASGVAVALLPPLAVVILCELVLGAQRTHARGVCLVPLVLVSALASGLDTLGVDMPGGRWAPSIAGGAVSLALAAWIRPVVPAKEPEAAGDPGGPSKVVGVLLLVLVLVAGGHQAVRVAGRWSEMGPLPPGSTTPAFDLALLGGGRFSSASLQGKVSVLVFWASWCSVCTRELPTFQELHEDPGNSGVQVVAVNIEGHGSSVHAMARKLAPYRDAHGLTLPVAVDDGTLDTAFRVRTIPHTVVLDGRGQVRSVHLGAVRKATLEREIAAARSE